MKPLMHWRKLIQGLELAKDINRRLDKLFLVFIINFVAIIGFLLKIILNGLIK